MGLGCKSLVSKEGLMIKEQTKIACCPNCLITIRIMFEECTAPKGKFSMDCPECGYPIRLELDPLPERRREYEL